jgi:hypothetical protein
MGVHLNTLQQLTEAEGRDFSALTIASIVGFSIRQKMPKMPVQAARAR